MASLYTRSADRQALARDAITKLSRQIRTETSIPSPKGECAGRKEKRLVFSTSLFLDGGGRRTRTFEAIRRLIYSQLPLPLGTLPRSVSLGLSAARRWDNPQRRSK